VVLCLAVFVQCRLVTDTDSQTHDDGIYSVNIASRGKNRSRLIHANKSRQQQERRIAHFDIFSIIKLEV